MHWADIVNKLLTGVAAIGALYVAWSGLHTWKRQLRGQAEYDVARRVLRAVLRLRDEFAVVRSPVISGGEFVAAFKGAGLEPPEPVELVGVKGQELVYERRWKRLIEASTELEAEVLEAEVLWGQAIRAPELILRRLRAEIYSAVRMYMDLLSSPRPSESLSQVVHEQERILYQAGSPGKEDEFGGRIEAAVKSFETILRPHLSRGR